MDTDKFRVDNSEQSEADALNWAGWCYVLWDMAAGFERDWARQHREKLDLVLALASKRGRQESPPAQRQQHPFTK